jgi:ferrous iron transport protein B
MLAKEGLLDPVQIVVSLTVMTLFVPCIANFFMMVKEQGMKIALYMAAFIFPFAFIVGGALNWVLRTFHVEL